ncbi:DUF3515 domain-containing protein [Allokutzneria albata]|uniref:DUF3515 domain-containing protein n=1 Tax=Allokutzneria albata TaxID=211114 RepID=A0A1G9XGM0_ALLAB|nr:DUF3515 domain-containing protein [Allokutzneria albata]SDM95898.1 Protein of unknown function [Allokutzneria albata]
MPDKPTDNAFPRPLVILAVGLPVLLAVAVGAIGLLSGPAEHLDPGHQQEISTARRTGPLALPPVPAPGASTPECRALLDGLPAELTSNSAKLPRRQLAEPAPVATVAWGSQEVDPIILRCGLGRPAELSQTSPLLVVGGVSWLEIAEPGVSTWVAVDRPVYAVLTVPKDAGTGPLQEVSAAIAKTLPPRSPDLVGTPPGQGPPHSIPPTPTR